METALMIVPWTDPLIDTNRLGKVTCSRPPHLHARNAGTAGGGRPTPRVLFTLACGTGGDADEIDVSCGGGGATQFAVDLLGHYP